MFGASDTVQCTKMFMDVCCSCDLFLATSILFFLQVNKTADFCSVMTVFFFLLICVHPC